MSMCLEWGFGVGSVGMSLTAVGSVCIDRACEESSVLAARVAGKAADVGFIDGVQERAVSLKQTRKDQHTVCLCACMRVYLHLTTNGQCEMM